MNFLLRSLLAYNLHNWGILLFKIYKKIHLCELKFLVAFSLNLPGWSLSLLKDNILPHNITMCISSHWMVIFFWFSKNKINSPGISKLQCGHHLLLEPFKILECTIEHKRTKSITFDLQSPSKFISQEYLYLRENTALKELLKAWIGDIVFLFFFFQFCSASNLLD